jgi:protein SCO1/2
MRNIWIIFLLFNLPGCHKVETPSKAYNNIDVTWQHPDADFHLTDFNGIPRKLTDFKDKVTILFFGYTHCPEVCPITLSNLAKTMQILGPEAERVQIIFITLDPERDTPQLLAKFIPSFFPTFLGLYGDVPSTAAAADTFGVHYAKQFDKHGSYSVDHSDGTFLIGLNRQPILQSPYGQSPALLASDIKQLLKNRLN